MNSWQLFDNFNQVIDCGLPFHTTPVRIDLLSKNNSINELFYKLYKNPILYTIKSLMHSCILSLLKSRKDSMRSPSMKPNDASVLRSVLNARQKSWSILPTDLITLLRRDWKSRKKLKYSWGNCATNPSIITLKLIQYFI